MELDNLKALHPVEVRLHNLMGIVYSGHRISTWCFSSTTRHLYFSSAMHEKHLEKFFRMGGCAEAARDAFTGVRQGAEVSAEALFLNCFSGWGLLLAPVLLTAGTALLVTEGQRTGASMFTKVREGRTLYALARAAGPLLAGGVLLTAVSLLSFLVLSILCPGFYAAGGTDGAFFGLPASRAGFLVSLLLDSFLAGILFSVPGTLAAAVFQDRYMLLCLPFLATYAVRQVLLRLAMEGVITFELYDLMDAAAHIGRGRPEGAAAAAALALAGLLASFLAWQAEAERGR